jgi:hypothetical protein
MKQLLALTAALVFLSMMVNAQDKQINNAPVKEINNGSGFGFQLNQYQKDFGFGLNATTRYFFRKSMAVRVRSNIMWNEHLDLNTAETTWSPYGNVSLGFVGVGGMVGDFIRLYGEGGLLCILPSKNFASPSVVVGGYGLFGFEFFMTKGFNYFIEIGGVGSGAVEDKIPGKPIYSNGLSVGVGFRASF